jgi:uncharacterized membrane protein
MPVRTQRLWDRFIKPAIDSLTLVVSLIGLASIWIAIHEMRMNEEVSWVTTYQTIETASLEMDKMLVEHPNLVPFFLSGTRIENTDKEYNQAVALADARLGAIDAILTYAQFRHADEQIVGWRNTFIKYLRASPLMCERLATNSENYGLINPLSKAACVNGPDAASSPVSNIHGGPCSTPPFIRC